MKKEIRNQSYAVDHQERRTTFTEYSDGSAQITEHGAHPRGSAPVRPLLYSADFEAGSEDAADCIRAARK